MRLPNMTEMHVIGFLHTGYVDFSRASRVEGFSEIPGEFCISRYSDSLTCFARPGVLPTPVVEAPLNNGSFAVPFRLFVGSLSYL